jgi:hypothetical protein
MTYLVSCQLVINGVLLYFSCTSIALQLYLNCKLHFDFISIVLQLYFNCTSIVFQLYFNCTSIVLQLHFNCSSIVLRPCTWITVTPSSLFSNLPHLFFTSSFFLCICFEGRKSQKLATLPPSTYNQICNLHATTNFDFKDLLSTYRRDAKAQNFHGPISRWKPLAACRVIPAKQMKYMKFSDKVLSIRRVQFKGVTFATSDYQYDKVGCNNFIKNEYNDDDDGETFSVGKIRRMYAVKLFTRAEEDIHVIVEGDWFCPVEDSPLGLPQVEYSTNFESERCGFLSASCPYNVALWPSDPRKNVRLADGTSVVRVNVDVNCVEGVKYCLIDHRSA